MAEADAVKSSDKPIRVTEGEVVIGRCPLCGKPLVAQVEVEVRLGPLTIAKAVDTETGSIPVDVSAQPRLRRLQIEHECKAPPVTPRTRKSRTPRVKPEPDGDAPPIPIAEDARPEPTVLTDEAIQQMSDEEAQRAADEAHERPFQAEDIDA